MPRNLYLELCSYENLLFAFRKARKHKTLRPYVIEYEKQLEENLLQLRSELLLKAYRPMPLKIFILKDPKTRKISVSDFRDRIVHHALCNIIQPIIEPSFIYDSYANRIGKGTLKAIARFESFMRQVSHNFTRDCYVLKADIRHYFDEVDHETLMDILRAKIRDKDILWLIRIILENHPSRASGKGMPLGNLTSQFFANVYLTELDKFAKHGLKTKYYIRYVDDFVVIDHKKSWLQGYIPKLNAFLGDYLSLQLHPGKTRIIGVMQGIPLLGFRIFPHYRLLHKGNLRRFRKKLGEMVEGRTCGTVDCDPLYDFVEGWIAYARNADTYLLRRRLIRPTEQVLLSTLSSREIGRLSSYAPSHAL